jgi:hypothetical protein
LERYMPERHVRSRKIGFHAPATRFVSSNAFRDCFDRIRGGDLPEFLDAGKVERILQERLDSTSNQPLRDYFLYSLVNLCAYAQAHLR